jgi:hypothetical protein
MKKRAFVFLALGFISIGLFAQYTGLSTISTERQKVVLEIFTATD